MNDCTLNTLKQLAKGIAAHFGPGCEVVIHDLDNTESPIAFIVNGSVTGRKAGDGPSHVVLEQLENRGAQPEDHLCYLTKTPEGKVLKSSTMYIRGENGRVEAIFSVNLDISALVLAASALEGLVSTEDREPEKITNNVNDLLDELIEQSVALVGKPAALMNKDDRARAVRYLSDTGAFLITKSGDKVSKYFGISKYTLYSYIDSKNAE